MKTVTHPVTGQQFKFGRNVPTVPHGKKSMSELISLGLLPNVTVPSRTFYSPPAATSMHDIYKNDTIGCCVIAGGFHVRGLTSFNSGAGVMFSDAQVVQDYSAIGGYNPNAPLNPDGSNPTDNGCDENTALAYWESTGFPDGVKLTNAIAVDPTNIEEIKLAVYLFENIFFGVALPDAWINPFPSGPGFWWDVNGASDPNNGHCFIGVDLIPEGVKIETWGMCGFISYPAIAKYAASNVGGQLFTLLSPDIISRVSQKSPAGYDINTLMSYFSQL